VGRSAALPLHIEIADLPRHKRPSLTSRSHIFPSGPSLTSTSHIFPSGPSLTSTSHIFPARRRRSRRTRREPPGAFRGPRRVDRPAAPRRNRSLRRQCTNQSVESGNRPTPRWGRCAISPGRGGGAGSQGATGLQRWGRCAISPGRGRRRSEGGEVGTVEGFAGQRATEVDHLGGPVEVERPAGVLGDADE
jgi:hypothetical protein